MNTTIDPLDLDRSLCGDLSVAESREWLVTNGMGGFGAGTIAGTLTRRYHGLLFAAYAPPNGRRLLCPKIDAVVEYAGTKYALSTDRWQDGTLAPQGFVHVTGFRLEGTVPVWSFACADAVLERRIWMEHEANQTYVSFRVVRAGAPVNVQLGAFANYRDLHAMTRAGDWTMEVAAKEGGVTVVPFAGAGRIAFRADRGTVDAQHVWYRNFDHPEERARGLDALEDHLLVATFAETLAEGESLTLAVADHELAAIDGGAALARRRRHDDETLAAWRAQFPQRAGTAPSWVPRLVLAADQFVVRCPLSEDPDARSVIAGYPWFGDWGRDTAISLPGLTLATGRPAIARSILLTFARFIDGGMLPNYFPSDGRPAEYNTVDASLWFVEAVRRYVDQTGDTATLRAIYPVLCAIVDAYTKGTRFGIAVDPSDGLLRAGRPGVQLTWMDAKVGDYVVTPRIGKPVEVNALWISALRTCARFAVMTGGGVEAFATAARRAEDGFERFWNAGHGWCYDVIDGPAGDDASLRPNQLFAVSLPIDVLDEHRRRAIVDACARHLASPAGLRSLAPEDPRYVGRYAGDPLARDGAYHQGTVWTWLTGTFVAAQRRVYPQRDADSLLAEVAAGLRADAIGTLAEIADADAPFAARGAFAQAWSVAALLDAWATGPTAATNADREVSALTREPPHIGRMDDMKTRSLALLATAAFALTGTQPVLAADKPTLLIKSVRAIDTARHTVVFPIHKGSANGKTVWYILTDASDAAQAKARGLVFAPLFANVGSTHGRKVGRRHVAIRRRSGLHARPGVQARPRRLPAGRSGPRRSCRRRVLAVRQSRRRIGRVQCADRRDRRRTVRRRHPPRYCGSRPRARSQGGHRDALARRRLRCRKARLLHQHGGIGSRCRNARARDLRTFDRHVAAERTPAHLRARQRSRPGLRVRRPLRSSRRVRDDGEQRLAPDIAQHPRRTSRRRPRRRDLRSAVGRLHRRLDEGRGRCRAKRATHRHRCRSSRRGQGPHHRARWETVRPRRHRGKLSGRRGEPLKPRSAYAHLAGKHVVPPARWPFAEPRA